MAEIDDLERVKNAIFQELPKLALRPFYLEIYKNLGRNIPKGIGDIIYKTLY